MRSEVYLFALFTGIAAYIILNVLIKCDVKPSDLGMYFFPLKCSFI